MFIFALLSLGGGMVDTRDLKSLGQQCPCEFESHPRHKEIAAMRSLFVLCTLLVWQLVQMLMDYIEQALSVCAAV